MSNRVLMGQMSKETPGGIQMEGKDMKKMSIKGKESPKKEGSFRGEEEN